MSWTPASTATLPQSGFCHMICSTRLTQNNPTFYKCSPFLVRSKIYLPVRENENGHFKVDKSFMIKTFFLWQKVTKKWIKSVKTQTAVVYSPTLLNNTFYYKHNLCSIVLCWLWRNIISTVKPSVCIVLSSLMFVHLQTLTLRRMVQVCHKCCSA